MERITILARNHISFKDQFDVLAHIGNEMLNTGIVKTSYPQALLDREKEYPTGIEFDGYSIAIPHCDAIHAVTPAIYVIRPNSAVLFDRADDVGTVAAQLIIALVVTDPKDQLMLLKNLFINLQDFDFFNALMNAKDEASIISIFKNKILSLKE